MHSSLLVFDFIFVVKLQNAAAAAAVAMCVRVSVDLTSLLAVYLRILRRDYVFLTIALISFNFRFVICISLHFLWFCQMLSINKHPQHFTESSISHFKCNLISKPEHNY